VGTGDTRQELLDAALEVLRAKGVTGMTTKEVALAAGRSEGSIYNHFTDKIDLVGHLLDAHLPTLLAVLVELPERVGRYTVRANLERAANALVAFHAQILPVISGVMGDPEMLARMQADVLPHDKGPHRPHHGVADYLRAEQALGRINAASDCQALSFLFNSACHQYAFLDLVSGPERNPLSGKRFAPTIVRTLLAGHEPARPNQES
jgi:AcrR family transcriptional regulator